MASPWVSIDATSDRRERARALTAARESVLAGAAAPKGAIRQVISASWGRSKRAGVDADAGLAPVSVDSGEARSRWETHPVAPSIPAARELLRDVGRADHQVLLFCDADGTLLWIDGERRVQGKTRTVAENHLAAHETVDADFGALQVAEHADITTRLLRGFPHQGDAPRVVSNLAMRKIQAYDVDSRTDDIREHFGIVRGRTQRRDDFRASYQR